jgi:hypothetical protein
MGLPPQRGSDIRTNGDCVGTGYEGMMWDILYIGSEESEGNEWFPK